MCFKQLFHNQPAPDEHKSSSHIYVCYVLHLASHPVSLTTSSGQILLEPAVIQDVLSAGSHLQLLELLNLCSHYLIQVYTHTHTHIHWQLFCLYFAVNTKLNLNILFLIIIYSIHSTRVLICCCIEDIVST